MLLIAGAHELLPPGAAPGSAEKAQAMARVFALMGYDLGLLAPQEAAMLDQAGANPGDAFASPDGVEMTTLALDDGRTAGVVLFPPPPPGENASSSEMIQAVDRAVQELAQNSDLTLGVSQWGYFNERTYLKQAQSPVDILLGSGPGLALSGKIAAQGRCLWVRPYSRGKSMMKIEVFRWPKRGGFQWTKESVRATSVPLDATVRQDPEAASILADTPQQ
jgi:hypothetical protein